MTVGSGVVVGHGLQTGQLSPLLRGLPCSIPHGQVGHGDLVVGAAVGVAITVGSGVVVGHGLQTGQ
jgi:hypothetical protein